MSVAASAIDGPVLDDQLEETDHRLAGEIDENTLRKYFTLNKADLEQVDQCRGQTNKLGFAIQLCVLRWHGYFLPDTRDIPCAHL
jgi:TnpA family transposase